MTKFIKHINISKLLVLLLFAALPFSGHTQVSVGNQTTNITNPNGIQITFDHNHDTGANGVLVVAISTNVGNTVLTVKYDNVLMDERLNRKDGSFVGYGFWELGDPNPGIHEIEITMTSFCGNKVATVVQSFNGALTGGLVGYNDRKLSPHVKDRLSITQGSVMMVMGICEGDPKAQDFTIDGVATSRTLLKGQKFMGVATSTAALSSGSVTCITTSNKSWRHISNQTLEILLGENLPIELIDFNVKAEGCFANLTWSTASEINNDYFIVEYSYDGINWQEIDYAKVDGAGNSSEVIDYSFYDFDCSHNRLVYYRLVQVDFDGTRSNSVIKSLNLAKPKLVKVYPNPTNGHITIDVNSEFGNKNGNVVVKTIAGQKVFSKAIVNGKNEFDLSKLAADTYVIKVSSLDQLPYYEKLIIIK